MDAGHLVDQMDIFRRHFQEFLESLECLSVPPGRRMDQALQEVDPCRAVVLLQGHVHDLLGLFQLVERDVYPDQSVEIANGFRIFLPKFCEQAGGFPVALSVQIADRQIVSILTQ